MINSVDRLRIIINKQYLIKIMEVATKKLSEFDFYYALNITHKISILEKKYTHNKFYIEELDTFYSKMISIIT